jgi:hypothetical protein
MNAGVVQGRIIPGKGVPRRDPIEQQQLSGGAKLAPAAHWEHQPALANVYTKQQQGLTGSHTQVAKGLDAFSMGDIRQAEKFIESGRMGLDEYARKLASGEITKDFAPDVSSGGGFFADETDESIQASRPWLGGNTSQASNRIVPGSARVVPPPPPANAPVGKDSNVAGLALLQMLVDRKQQAGAGQQQPKAAPAPPAPPRQLSQQQINELIAMSKRAAPKQPATGRPTGVPLKAPGPAVQTAGRNPPAAAAPQVTPPHVTALLEQLHRQQMAQQQQPAPPQQQSGTPQECQQQ